MAEGGRAREGRVKRREEEEEEDFLARIFYSTFLLVNLWQAICWSANIQGGVSSTGDLYIKTRQPVADVLQEKKRRGPCYVIS